MAIDYQLYSKHSSEYSEKFSKAYKTFMNAVGDATTRYGGKLPAYSTEYERALSQALAEYLKALGDLRGKYKDLTDVYWQQTY